jgi:hypothetical protein
MANAGSFVKGVKRPNQGKRGPSKLTQTVKEAFEIAFQELQKAPGARLADWAKDNPTDFYRIAAKLIPQATTAEISGPNGADIPHKLTVEYIDPASR